MKHRSVAAATVLMLMSGLGVIAAPFAHAAGGGPQLVDVQLSQASVAVSGLAHADVAVRVHLTSVPGVNPYGMEGNPGLPIAFARVGPGRGQVDGAAEGRGLQLESGDAHDGWWSQTIHVTAGYDGAFAVTSVYATDVDGGVLSVDPRTQGIAPTLQVIGSNIPHLQLRYAPKPLAIGTTLTMSGTVTFADTGAAAPGAPVVIGFDNRCGPDGLGSISTVTDGSGRWRLQDPHWVQGGSLHCAFLLDDKVVNAYVDGPALFAELSFAPQYWVPFSARMATHHVGVGTKVAVTGQIGKFVYGAYSDKATVYLQRIVGRRWRTVGTTVTTATGVFALIAQPPTRGTHYYRVLLAPQQPAQLPSTSSVLLLTAS